MANKPYRDTYIRYYKHGNVHRIEYVNGDVELIAYDTDNNEIGRMFLEAIDD